MANLPEVSHALLTLSQTPVGELACFCTSAYRSFDPCFEAAVGFAVSGGFGGSPSLHQLPRVFASGRRSRTVHSILPNWEAPVKCVGKSRAVHIPLDAACVGS